MHVCANICGILGDINRESGTIRVNLLAATLVTSQSVLPIPINYLVPIQPPIPPSNNSSAQASTPSTEDVQDPSIPPATKLSVEKATNNRLQESNKS